MKIRKYLFLIPARKNSKRLPNKNTRLLRGKPLISYSLEYANSIAKSSDSICVSTNDDKVIEIAKNYKNIRFILRPDLISNDETSMEEVLFHTLNIYESENQFFDAIILLQPTSPMRKISDFKNLISKYNDDIDMVVSVRESRENPYYLLYEEDNEGYLFKSKKADIKRSQDSPKVFCLNGAFFMYNLKSLKHGKLKGIKRTVKFSMPYKRSIDIDDIIDWELTEIFMSNEYGNNNEG